MVCRPLQEAVVAVTNQQTRYEKGDSITGRASKTEVDRVALRNRMRRKCFPCSGLAGQIKSRCFANRLWVLLKRAAMRAAVPKPVRFGTNDKQAEWAE
jgi:hypothetical protein